MKKIFTLATLLVLALTVNAQETYRKSWDFTKWSAATVANLKAESAKGPTTGAWSDVEKATATEPTETSKDNCFWEVTAQGNATTPATLMANGEVIAELEGLGYTNTTARSLAIAVNYPTALNDYNGASYLWLGSKTKNYFVIPHVAPGTTIKMGVESHKFAEARGVELYIGIGNSGTKLKDPDGNDVAIPTTYVDQEWLVPAEGLTDTPNEDGTFDVTIRNTNGCHIYYITVGDGDSPQVEEAKKVAYLHASGINMEEYTDLDYMMLDGNEKFDLTTIAATEDVTLESLADFDAVLVSSSVTKEKEANVVKPLIGFIPVINLNANIYEKLGLGSTVKTDVTELTITDPTNAIFEGIEAVTYEEGITAVELGDYFKNDAVLAMAGDKVAIHVHNPGRNAYYYIPSDYCTTEMIPQAIVAAAKTKRAIAAVGTPVITFTQEDGQSVVTITAANSKAIYYTTDGTDPTTESTRYTEPFTLTDSLTVKAFATGDGYTDSKIAEKKIAIAHKAAAPSISVSREAGKSIITISAAEGTTAYFNFNKAKTTALSQPYTEPIELTEPVIISVLTEGEGLLPSDLVSQYVGINGIDNTTIRLDTLAHFNANETDWFINDTESGAEGKASAYYFWGKAAWNYYTDEVEDTKTVKASDGVTDSIINIYKVNPEALKVINPLNENGWVLKSEGQVLTGELQLAPGEGVGNGATGRFAEEAIDFIGTPSKGVITFGAKTSGDPYTARIESTKKLAGPFDVIVYCGNGNNAGAGILEIQTSADGETWATLDTLKMAATQRYIKRTRASFNETAEVFLRVAQVSGGTKAQVYDILVMNNGELSKAYSEADMAEKTGIQTVQPQGTVVSTEVFTLGGSRIANAGRGMQIVRKTYANGAVVTKKVLR